MYQNSGLSYKGSRVQIPPARRDSTDYKVSELWSFRPRSGTLYWSYVAELRGTQETIPYIASDDQQSSGSTSAGRSQKARQDS